ncbi:hypothetical protein GH5_03314 [Leishmania sp. Ghana 2012 LV757]|uniref:hypothetical protein n=1 Tax=Leishmania sp. Ghana 2012 LV757 TaxID=2803181 RepID=UPI001B733527|nr:hypothetical protein GH5_03314 [Leishmania sp. Ghana 2012 LV757]
MADLAVAASAVAGDKDTFTTDSKSNRASQTVASAETQRQGKTDAAGTHTPSAEVSFTSSAPRIDSFEISSTAVTPLSPGTAVPRWSSLKEALEACMDPVFLAGSADVKADKIAEEVLLLMDATMTVHLPALVGLSCLQPLFTGHTRSERVDAVLSAVRASNKLMLRGDLPVPSSSDCTLSEAEAEAAELRVGLHSNADGDAPVLECRPHTPGCAAPFCSPALSRLKATTPPQRMREAELTSCAPCALPVALTSPVASDNAHVMYQPNLPHTDAGVPRHDGAGDSTRALPVAPASPAPVSEESGSAALPAPRTAQLCPRAKGEDPLRPLSRDGAADLQATNDMPTLRLCVPVPKPPPAIDAVMMEAADKSYGARVSSSAKEAASTFTARSASPAPATSSFSATANRTTRSLTGFSVHVAPFVPAERVNTTSSITPIDDQWRVASHAPRLRQWAFSDAPAAGCADVSEALANHMLMDSNAAWMCAPLSLRAGSSCGEKCGALGTWGRGSTITPPAPVGELPCKEKLLPAKCARKALTPDMTHAPLAVGDSLASTHALPITGLRRPRPLAVSAVPESVPRSGFDGCRSMRAPTVSVQLPPFPLSQTRRHRHDPYSSAGFAVCAETSSPFPSSQANMPTALALTSSASPRLSSTARTIGSARERTSFCFADPLIKASARLQERRRLLRADATGTTSCERESVSCSITHSDPAGESGDAESVPCRSLSSCNKPLVPASGVPTADAAVTFLRPIDEDAAAVTLSSKSYAEALLLNMKSASPAVLMAGKVAQKSQVSRDSKSNTPRLSAEASSSPAKCTAAMKKASSGAAPAAADTMGARPKRQPVSAS